MSRRRASRWALGAVLLLCGAVIPVHAQVPGFILDFQNVEISDVAISVGKITGRQLVWDERPRGTITLLADRHAAPSEVLPLTVFMLSMLDFELVEQPGGDLKIEPIGKALAPCSRERADTERVAAELARRGEGGRLTFRFESARTADVLRMMSRALGSLIIFKSDVRSTLDLSSGGAVPVDEAFRLLAAALEREEFALLAAPSPGTIGVVPCGGEPHDDPIHGARPRVIGSLFGGARELHLALLDEDLSFERRPTVAAVRSEGVTLELDGACRLFAVGELGAGKVVTCPAKYDEPRPPPDPRSLEPRDSR